MKEISEITSIDSQSLYSLNLKPIFKTRINPDAILRYHTDDNLEVEWLKSSFQIINKEVVVSERNDKQIGKVGESAVYNFLRLLYKNDPFKHQIVWHNTLKESFMPCDIELGKSCPIDVKTTRLYENKHFHISLKEAKFITGCYNSYLIARVFPLLKGVTYFGLQIASYLGVNFYKFKTNHYKDFCSAVQEAENLGDDSGFLVKPEWLENILTKKLSDFLKIYYGKEEKYYSALEVFESNIFTDDIFVLRDVKQNVQVYKLIKFLRYIINGKDKNTFAPIEHEHAITNITEMWDSKFLKRFLNEVISHNEQTIKTVMRGAILLQKNQSIDGVLVNAGYNV